MEKPNYLTDFGGSQLLQLPQKGEFPASSADKESSYAQYAVATGEYAGTETEPQPIESAPAKSPRSSPTEYAPVIESHRIALPRELTIRVEQFKWNSVFQEYYDMIFKDAGEHFSVIATALGRISALYQDFLRTAVMYTKIIVQERFVPNFQKSIKPSEVGGVAGGDKYIVEGIFFKFATDKNNIYGGIDNAAKSFGHELRALSVLQNLAIDLLHVPLFVVIDYRGFRVAAQSLVPIGKAAQRDTLKFGSADAGHKVRDEDKTLSARFAEAGKMLNLAEHAVGLDEKETLHTRMPIDIEGHLGSDGRYYVLDAARLMPPEAPSIHGSHLFRLLRPEFVRSYCEPLCNDSFAHFIAVDPNRREYSKSIKEATLYLRKTVIPKFSKWLLAEEAHGSRVTLSQEMHDRGINVRSLGILYEAIRDSSAYWRCRILTEMIVRIAKLTVRILMRTAMEKIKLATHEPYVRVVVQYFNLLFGNSSESIDYWANELSHSVRLSFFYHLDCKISLKSAVPAEEKKEPTIPEELVKLSNELVDLPLLFRDLVPKCGIRLVNQQLLSSMSNTLLEQEQPFSETDFGETVPLQKNMDIVEYSYVYATYQKYFQFGPRSDLIEPILKKISVNNTPGPFYVPYLAARACFALWQQLRISSSAANSPQLSSALGSSSPPLVGSPGLADSRKSFKERLYSSGQTWGTQQTLENISLSLSYSNIPKLTTERFLSIFQDEVLFLQAKARKPSIYKLLNKWAVACSGCGCDDFLGSILCCQVLLTGGKVLKQIYELHPKIHTTARLYKYYLAKLEMIGMSPEEIQKSNPISPKLAQPSPRRQHQHGH